MSVAGIEDILPRYQEIADGTKTEFTVAFELIENQFVSVYLGTEKQSSGYNVDLTNKKVIFDSAPNSGLLVTIVRAVPASWESNLHGALNSEGINQLFTHIMASIQTVKEEVSRAVKSNIYDNVDGGQLSEFFLKQLVDAQDILDRAESNLVLLNSASQTALSDLESARTSALSDINQSYQNSLNDITTTSNQAVSSIASAKDSAITDMNTILTSVEESKVNAAASANAAKASADKAKETADSIVNESADKDLSNLSVTGQAKFDAKQDRLTAGTGISIEGNVINNTQTSAEWGNIEGDLSNQTDLQTALNNKVSKTDDENIDGTKNILKVLNLRSGTNIYNLNVTKGTNPTATQYWDVFRCNDNTNSSIWQNTRLGIAELSITTDGTTQMILGAYRNEAGSSASSLLTVGYNLTSGAYATAPTPPTDSNGANIANTSWVNSRITSVMNSQIRVVSRGNNWIRFDDGLFIQWGHLTATERNNTVISFNTPFIYRDSICIYYGAMYNATTNQNTTYSTQDWNTVNFTVRNITEAAGQGSTQARWLAIGY